MDVQLFHGRGPHPLLWAGSRATRGKIRITGIPNLLKYSAIYIAYMLVTNVSRGT